MKNLMREKPFSVERLRDELAKNSDFEELRKTYSGRLPEIKDLNTSHLWNELNRRDELDSSKNYMEEDKLSWVVKNTLLKKLSVLNIGFGSGNLENRALVDAYSDYSWYGVDISTESVKTAQRKFKGAKFSLGDISKLKFKDNTFDCVICLEVLEHIPPSKILNSLNEVHRVLKSRGSFIISVPLNEDLETMVKNNENYNAHVRVYTPDLIKAELFISGFSVKKSKLIYAFRNFYQFKTFLVTNILKDFREPNGIIVVAKKK